MIKHFYVPYEHTIGRMAGPVLKMSVAPVQDLTYRLRLLNGCCYCLC